MIVLGVDPSSTQLAFFADTGDYLLSEKIKLGKKYEPYHPFAAYQEVSLYLGRLLDPLAKGNDLERAAFVEAPTGAARLDMQSLVKQAMVSGGLQVALYEWGFKVYLIPPSTWKKEIGAGGNASKDAVRGFLETNHEAEAELCEGDQDRFDALGLALCGQRILRRLA